MQFVDGIALFTKFGDLITADHKTLNVETESRCGRQQRSNRALRFHESDSELSDKIGDNVVFAKTSSSVRETGKNLTAVSLTPHCQTGSPLFTRNHYVWCNWRDWREIKAGQLKLLNLKKWPQNPKSSQSAEKVSCSLVKTKGDWVICFTYSGNNITAELGAEAVWENFALWCKLSSIEISAMELDVRSATGNALVSCATCTPFWTFVEYINTCEGQVKRKILGLRAACGRELKESEAAEIHIKRFSDQEVFVKGSYEFPCEIEEGVKQWSKSEDSCSMSGEFTYRHLMKNLVWSFTTQVMKHSRSLWNTSPWWDKLRQVQTMSLKISSMTHGPLRRAWIFLRRRLGLQDSGSCLQDFRTDTSGQMEDLRWGPTSM